jgi:hypothetical protein
MEEETGVEKVAGRGEEREAARGEGMVEAKGEETGEELEGKEEG